jgi:hypothetical protein
MGLLSIRIHAASADWPNDWPGESAPHEFSALELTNVPFYLLMRNLAAWTGLPDASQAGSIQQSAERYRKDFNRDRLKRTSAENMAQPCLLCKQLGQSRAS